jgi:hypothetical protein
MQGIKERSGAIHPHPKRFDGPQAWTAREFSGPSDWLLLLSEEIRRELKSAVAHARQYCADAAMLALDDYSEDEARLLYAGLGTHLGTILPQNLRGDKLYSVRDEGIRVEAEYGRTGVRFSKSSAAFDFHTDSPSRVAGHTPDVIGLLALRTAKAGGESALVSGYALHNILSEERPDVLRRLYRPFWVDRRAELPPGEEPVLPVPVFTFDGRLTVRYLRFYITKGQEWKAEPLSSEDVEALDVFEEVMRRPDVAVKVPVERGDLQLVSNTFLLHSRASYEDYAEPERKRHYLRLWLADRAG